MINTSIKFARDLAISNRDDALLGHRGDGLRYKARGQMCVHPLCSLQPLHYINPPFQKGFTFHHFINRLSGVVDEASIHSREWGQQLKSKGCFLYWASNHGPESTQECPPPCPSAWPSTPSYLQKSHLQSDYFFSFKCSRVSNTETHNFQVIAL